MPPRSPADETAAPAQPRLVDLEAAAYRAHPEHPAHSAPTYDLSEASNRVVPRGELVLAIVALVLWTAFFCGGVFVPTGELRLSLWSGKLALPTALMSLVVVVSCYTLTNILLLCCAAALLGCMTRRWYVSDHARIEISVETIPPVRVYLSALLRGFFLYLVTIAGFLTVTTEQSLIDTKLDQYIRIAGVTSVLAFIVGYDPRILNRMLSRIMDAAEVGPPPRRPEPPPPAAERARSEPRP